MQESDHLRTVVITGANKGIGHEIIKRLLGGSTPYDIILTARNIKLGQEASDGLTKKYSSSQSKLTFHQLDLTASTSVEDFIKWIKAERNSKIDVLVNNAGIYPQGETPQNIIDIISTNFLRTVELTEKLLPYLASDGKIIMVSSILGVLSSQSHETAKALDDPTLTRERLLELANQLIEKGKAQTDWTDKAYYVSKALISAYTRWVLVKKLKGDQQCYTLHPGWVQSDMGGKNAPSSLESGADTPVYLINLPFKNDERYNGKYFDNCTVSSF